MATASATYRREFTLRLTRVVSTSRKGSRGGRMAKPLLRMYFAAVKTFFRDARNGDAAHDVSDVGVVEGRSDLRDERLDAPEDPRVTEGEPARGEFLRIVEERCLEQPLDLDGGVGGLVSCEPSRSVGSTLGALSGIASMSTMVVAVIVRLRGPERRRAERACTHATGSRSPRPSSRAREPLPRRARARGRRPS